MVKLLIILYIYYNYITTGSLWNCQVYSERQNHNCYGREKLSQYNGKMYGTTYMSWEASVFIQQRSITQRFTTAD